MRSAVGRHRPLRLDQLLQSLTGLALLAQLLTQAGNLLLDFGHAAVEELEDAVEAAIGLLTGRHAPIELL